MDMKSLLRFFYLPLALFFAGILLSSFLSEKEPKSNISLPYKQAGLTEKQAALHLVNRFTYGIKANDIEQRLSDLQIALLSKTYCSMLVLVLALQPANIKNAMNRRFIYLLWS